MKLATNTTTIDSFFHTASKVKIAAIDISQFEIRPDPEKDLLYYLSLLLRARHVKLRKASAADHGGIVKGNSKIVEYFSRVGGEETADDTEIMDQAIALASTAGELESMPSDDSHSPDTQDDVTAMAATQRLQCKQIDARCHITLGLPLHLGNVDDAKAEQDRFANESFTVTSGYGNSKRAISAIMREDTELWEGEGWYSVCEICDRAGKQILGGSDLAIVPCSNAHSYSSPHARAGGV